MKYEVKITQDERGYQVDWWDGTRWFNSLSKLLQFLEELLK